ncbi:hypothetical protein [Methylocystis rosea]|uniref:hypothetical protein n=1 Tax=Methylocystis rosea TaxID=173366 RepID=UPI00036EEF1D|nr:hypothetical protein [Methylocystis rosea]
MKLFLYSAIGILFVAVVVLGSTVVRLENYRYANFVGFCSDYDIKNPVERINREECLNKMQTRTHWIGHLLYALRII